MANKAELIFIPAPGVGHVMSTVEIAKLLIARDERLSITVFIMNLPSDMVKNTTYSNLLANFASSERVKFINLPAVHIDPSATANPLNLLNSMVELQKANVKDSLSTFIAQPNSPKLAGFVIDMFCTPMIDVANEFNLPTYLFYTSNAGMLSLSLHFSNLRYVHNMDTTVYKDSDAELTIPGFVNPVPAKVLPWVVVDKSGEPFFNHCKRYNEVKGIMVNTFVELEGAAVEALSSGEAPPVYPVGPILSLSSNGRDGKTDDIMKWLDDQPKGSVVFMCFGSMGSFPDEQVREMAIALEKSGCRFLWSLRKSPPNGKFEMPSDYDNLSDVLPEGFLDRTAEIGKLIGWAPQVDILAHPSIGGFVSHCGWNSTLEGIWFGVPIATWPLYAEQQINAFALVKEFKMGVEIKMDYRKAFMSEEPMIIGADEIERGIRRLLEIDVEKVQKVREMSELSKKVLKEGGSSYVYLGNFIDDVLMNMP